MFNFQGTHESSESCLNRNCLMCSPKRELRGGVGVSSLRLRLNRRVVPRAPQPQQHESTYYDESSSSFVSPPSQGRGAFVVNVDDELEDEDELENGGLMGFNVDSIALAVEARELQWAKQKAETVKVGLVQRDTTPPPPEHVSVVVKKSMAPGLSPPVEVGWKGSDDRRRKFREMEEGIEKETASALAVAMKMAEDATAHRRKQEEDAKQKQIKEKQMADLLKQKEDAQKMLLALQEEKKKAQQQQQQQQKQQQQPVVDQQKIQPQKLFQDVESTPTPPSTSTTTTTKQVDKLAEFKSLAENFPKAQAAHLFRLKAPITKALNQVTNDPKVTLDRAKDIVATLKQAGELSPDISKLIQFHFSTQLCAMVTSKIGLKLSAVFAYAALAAFVCHHFPSVWDLLVASLQEKCPYLVPSLVARRANESEQAYKQRIGCMDDVKYIREHNGFVTFYAAICCAQVAPSGDWRSCMPHMGSLWSLLSALLNQNPTFVVPDLLTSIFEVAGPEFFLVYGRQAKKLMQYAHAVYLPMCKDKSKTLDGIVDTFLVQRLSATLEFCAQHGYGRTPEVDAKIFPDFLNLKRMFQMRQIQ